MKRVLALIICLSPLLIKAQGEMNVQEELKALRDYNRNLTHRIDELQKSIDDILWFNRLADVAVVDKVYMYGPPPAVVKNPTAMGANNPVKFWSYVFVPKGIDTSKKYPLIVFPHSGVHADFSTYYIHIVKELLAQGYIVVAPEFRGSTGYGKEFWEKIDYGGLEVQDTHASRNYMLENYEFVDKNRIGIIGWSHGGLITLMNIFDYPDDYKCAYAGVPVSDLIARMGYLTDDYRNLFSADYHIGKTANENVAEYRRRSPAWNTHKLKTPLLVHTNTNDDDVYSLEVEHLIKSLKADGKKFEYEIYQEAPGGHSFNRLDTKSAKEIRLKIYAFLAKYLNPPKELKSIADIDRAAYR
ncbi:MAG: prolyl oligopeptidase family serine peptidase [Tenuifilaceae bacterium]|jgi:dipeptidyl aminopeptidase/acylaminoacyl peptidase|nr:prolyl oligopeptidase family serine peptidase [Bacteroidales bacterium]MDI9516982.1 prolyl oligopeptidase family serine peptidase [Bacteroidota bacterium]NLH57036.1 S9 family peptidase [Rikenellaceae bacterium]OQC61140.1 MAG: Prolyl tripeptidyl peptidase precursor [Bacteroidetes bacterium ADurb.Bin008]HNV81511.1 prolyl oligopeptidase family serine peptidase [Tenuifilaceae bacterium]